MNGPKSIDILQETRGEAQGPQEWEVFDDIPLSMQPSPVFRVLNFPGELALLNGNRILYTSWRTHMTLPRRIHMVKARSLGDISTPVAAPLIDSFEPMN